jgi:hypothetical protein
MRWFWRRERDVDKESQETEKNDAVKRKVRQDQEFIRIRIRNLERAMRGEPWTPPR